MRSSAYSHYDYAKCPAQRSPEPGVIEIRACPGLAGIPVIWNSEPDSSSVDFGKATDESLGFGSFYEPETTVEWRGPMVAGAVKPLAAIVRYWTGPSVGKLNVSRLVVYRVAAHKPSCIIGMAGGSNANAAARAIADRHAASFVCGKSARVGAP